MTQLTQLKSLKQTKKDTLSQDIMMIDAEVPLIDYDWVKQKIMYFLEEQKILSLIKNIAVYFTEQPIEKNIIRCDMYVKINNKLLTATGQGMDEYQAIKSVLQNLELEFLLEQTIQQSKSSFFFSDSINQFQRGGRYA